MSKQILLPAIPEKRYFTIGEASDLCHVKPHVLRYWEQEFSQLKPVKRRGNRRYYQHKDIELVRTIRDLLYHKGYTINGAKKALTQQPAQQVVTLSSSTPTAAPVLEQTSTTVQAAHSGKGVVNKLIGDLENLLADIKEA